MGFIARLFRLHFSLWLGLAVLAVVALATPASAGLALRLAAGWDWVLLARPGAAEAPFAALLEDLAKAARKATEGK